MTATVFFNVSLNSGGSYEVTYNEIYDVVNFDICSFGLSSLTT